MPSALLWPLGCQVREVLGSTRGRDSPRGEGGSARGRRRKRRRRKGWGRAGRAETGGQLRRRAPPLRGPGWSPPRSGDIEAVDRHLVAMKITPSVHNVGEKPRDEAGDGAALSRLLNRCRVHYAYVTESVQDMIKDFRRQASSFFLQGPTACPQQPPALVSLRPPSPSPPPALFTSVLSLPARPPSCRSLPSSGRSTTPKRDARRPNPGRNLAESPVCFVAEGITGGGGRRAGREAAGDCEAVLQGGRRHLV